MSTALTPTQQTLLAAFEESHLDVVEIEAATDLQRRAAAETLTAGAPGSAAFEGTLDQVRAYYQRLNQLTTAAGPVGTAVHYALVAAMPELAHTVRELLSTGRTPARIIANLAAAGARDWVLDAVREELDYLLATGAAGDAATEPAGVSTHTVLA